MGSLYISLEQPDVALEYVRKSVALWFKPDSIPEEVDLEAIEAEDAMPAETVSRMPVQLHHLTYPGR